MDRHRPPRWTLARLPGFRGLRAAPGGFRGKALHGYDSWHDGDHCGQPICAIALYAAGPALFREEWERCEASGVFWAPEKAPKGPISIIVSGKDRTAYVYRNGVEIGRAPVVGLERLSGSYVYSALATADAAGRRDWISVASSGGRAPNLKDLLHRVVIAPDFLAEVRALITPGVTLVLTDAPVNPSSQGARGFNILTD